MNSKYTRDEHLQRRRKLFPEVSDADWNDWKWQVKNRIETVEELSKHIKLTGKEIEGIKDCLATLRMAITPYYLTLIDPDNRISVFFAMHVLGCGLAYEIVHPTIRNLVYEALRA